MCWNMSSPYLLEYAFFYGKRSFMSFELLQIDHLPQYVWHLCIYYTFTLPVNDSSYYHYQHHHLDTLIVMMTVLANSHIRHLVFFSSCQWKSGFFKYLCLTLICCLQEVLILIEKYDALLPKNVHRHLSEFMIQHLHDFEVWDAQAKECLFNDA